MSGSTPGTGLVVQSILPTLSDMPSILVQAQTRADRGVSAAESLISRCREADKISSDLDKELQETIVKITKTVELMDGDRKPYTQLMDEIKNAFTGHENRLKAMKVELQKFRDLRAKQVAEENKRKEEEAAKAAAKKKEEADIIAAVTRHYGECLNNKLYSRQKELQANFDSLTLDDIDARGEKLKAFIPSFPVGKLSEILTPITMRTPLHTDEERAVIIKRADAAYQWDAFYMRYEAELGKFKDDLVVRLPSKKAELQRAEDLRQEQERIKKEQEAAAKRQAELDRQQREAKSAADRQRVEDARKKQEEENKRLEAERLQKEQEAAREREAAAARKKEEDDRLAIEKKAADDAAIAVSEQARIQSHSQTLFDQTNAANLKEETPETRLGWEITVLEPAGWAEIFQFWFMGGGIVDVWTKDPGKVGDIDLNKMKAYAEKKADKEKIVSPLLEYKETYKAINRRTSTKKSAI